MLKLVAYTALKFPGVISVIGRILPFLAEPDFRYLPSPPSSLHKTLVQSLLIFVFPFILE